MPEPNEVHGPSSRAKTIAGFVVLLAALAFFVLDEVSLPLFGARFDLSRPAWALLIAAAYFFFGLDLSTFRIGIVRSDKDADADHADAGAHATPKEPA